MQFEFHCLKLNPRKASFLIADNFLSVVKVEVSWAEIVLLECFSKAWSETPSSLKIHTSSNSNKQHNRGEVTETSQYQNQKQMHINTLTYLVKHIQRLFLNNAASKRTHKGISKSTYELYQSPTHNRWIEYFYNYLLWKVVNFFYKLHLL